MASSPIKTPLIFNGGEAQSSAITPDNYPLGLTIAYTGAASDYPVSYSNVYTFKASPARVLQFCIQQGVNSIYVRGVSNGATWGAWKTIAIS